MSLPSLFMKETSEGDYSLTKLPQDMDLWAETVTSKIRQEVPQSRHMLIKITFIKKNEEQGTATGAATIHDQKLNKAVYFPLIVKNFQLYPLDIMMIPNKDEKSGFEVVPFSQDVFAESMFNSDPFDHLERPIDRIQQLYLNPQNNVIYPPYFRNVYASAGGVLEAVASSILPQDKQAFITYLQNNKDVLIGYEKRAHLDLLKKVADAKIVETPEAVEKLKNITLIKKKSDRTIQMISTSDEVFDPTIEEGDSGLVASCMSSKVPNPQETLNEVRQNGEKMIFSDLNPKDDAMLGPLNSPQHYTQTEDQPVDAKIFGSYKVQDKNGVFHKGIIIPNLIDFDMKEAPGRVFISQDKCSFQDKMVGIPTGAEKFQFMKFREPAIGMTGVFVAYNMHSAVATTPITIRSMYDQHGEDHIVGVDLNGNKIKIKYGGWHEDLRTDESFGKDSLKRIAKVKDFYIMPKLFKFLPMDNFCELSESAELMSLKTASTNMDSAPIRVIHTGDSQFALKGPDMTKMAKMCGWDSTNLSASQAVFLLASKKCPLEKVAQALKIAGSEHGECYVHGLPATKYTYEQNPEKEKIAQAILAEMSNVKVNLIKEAASIEDSQTVDAALALNFVNAENLDKFVSFIPMFEQCSRGLAQTLLASRLGINEIPENSTASAMHKLLEVIQGLKRIKVLEEKTASKSITGLKKILRDHAGKISVGAGFAGLLAGDKMGTKSGYKKGFNDGAVAMNNYMNTHLSGHMNKAASFFSDLDKKGK